ncbi:MAG: DNA repair protein RecO [Betaproteobacteria bacterium RIFCSPLOWO2_02_67_12]|nr:MAG: DNA repair protein RecO [Betaproteobacteria bacterium RIFCSPLOWO2_02_67_12]
MTRRRAVHEPGYVLHTYPYKETSLIVELFTRQHGRVGLLAKGARRPRSALRGVLLAFHPLHLSWSGSAELGTLVAADWAGGQPALSGIGVMCGFYLNELLLRLLPREDPHERLFAVYAASLAQLAAASDRAAVLRCFEHRLLDELGYAPLLVRDAASGTPVDPGRRYEYDPERGPLAANGSAGAVDGQTLLDIARDEYSRETTREEARQLLRALIACRLGSQVLHTRAVLAELQDL